MKIYDKKDVLILDVEPDDSSYAEDRIHHLPPRRLSARGLSARHCWTPGRW